MKTNSSDSKKLHISARAKLVPAIAMLSTSAIMLSTSTYAWFTMNKEVEVTGLQMTATAADSLEISLGKITRSADSYSVIQPGDTDSTCWSNAFAVSDYYSTIGHLKPASSINGKDFFYALDAGSQGTTANKFASISDDSTVTTTDKAAKTTLLATIKSNQNNTVTADSTDGSTGYFVDIPFYIRTLNAPKTQNTDDPLYAAVKITSADNPSTNSDLYKAVRVAIIKGTTSSPIFAEDNAYYSGTNAIKQANDTSQDPQKSTVEDVANLVNPIADCHSGANTNLGLTKEKDSGSAAGYRIDSYTIRVWLEGESQSCKDINAGQSWNIDLKFGLSADDIGFTEPAAP